MTGCQFRPWVAEPYRVLLMATMGDLRNKGFWLIASCMGGVQ